jgi:hypothetical protein
MIHRKSLEILGGGGRSEGNERRTRWRKVLNQGTESDSQGGLFAQTSEPSTSRREASITWGIRIVSKAACGSSNSTGGLYAGPVGKNASAIVHIRGAWLRVSPEAGYNIRASLSLPSGGSGDASKGTLVDGKILPNSGDRGNVVLMVRKGSKITVIHSGIRGIIRIKRARDTTLLIEICCGVVDLKGYAHHTAGTV